MANCRRCDLIRQFSTRPVGWPARRGEFLRDNSCSSLMQEHPRSIIILEPSPGEGVWRFGAACLGFA